MGVNPWCSPLQLFRELRGEIPPQEHSEVLEEGTEFEDAIFRMACRKYGWTEFTPMLPRDERGWVIRHDPITGHVDRFIIEDGKIVVVEVKHTLSGYRNDGKWGDPMTDQVPPGYRMQAMIYQDICARMGMMMADYSYVVARLNLGPELYVVQRDEKLIAELYETATAFLKLVADNDPPDPLVESDAKLRWMADPDVEIEANDVLLAQLRLLKVLSGQRKKLEEEESEVRSAILSQAGEASSIYTVGLDGKRVPVASVGSWRVFDEARFIAENPLLAAECQKLDTAAVKKRSAKTYESYMRRPQDYAEQRRQVRLLKGLDS